MFEALEDQRQWGEKETQGLAWETALALVESGLV